MVPGVPSVVIVVVKPVVNDLWVMSRASSVTIRLNSPLGCPPGLTSASPADVSPLTQGCMPSDAVLVTDLVTRSTACPPAAPGPEAEGASRAATRARHFIDLFRVKELRRVVGQGESAGHGPCGVRGRPEPCSVVRADCHSLRHSADWDDARAEPGVCRCILGVRSLGYEYRIRCPKPSHPWLF